VIFEPLEIVQNVGGAKRNLRFPVLIVVRTAQEENSILDLVAPAKMVALSVLDHVIAREKLLHAMIADVLQMSL
jgi:hypothetical protein